MRESVMAPNASLDSLIEQAKQNDSEWLYETLRARASIRADNYQQDVASFSNQEPSPKRRKSVDATPLLTRPAVWPFDRTSSLLLMQPRLVSDYVRFIHDFDWAATELGPLTGWDPNMRRKVNMCLTDKQAGVLWIGPKFIAFYNEAYAIMIGSKHPNCLGQPARELWGDTDVYEQFETMLRQAYEDGAAMTVEDMLAVATHHGARQETWCNMSLTPLPDGEGGVFGSYQLVRETTSRVVSARRHAMVLRINQAVSLAHSPAMLWQHVLGALDKEVADVSFAAVYTVDLLVDRDQTTCHLEGSVGLPPQYLPADLDAQSVVEKITPVFFEAMKQQQPFLISAKEGTFPVSLRKVARSRTQDDPCDAAVLLPIAPTDTSGVLAFIMVGLSPLASFNDDYKQLLSAIMHECRTSLATLQLIQEQSNFAERLASELAAKQKQATDMETRFQRMSDMSPVAMYHLDGAGRVLYANASWRDLTGVPLDRDEDMSWVEFVYPEDQVLANQEFIKLTQGQSVSFEMRWKRSEVMKSKTYGTADRSTDRELWTIASAYPELDGDGNVVGIFGTLTDITAQKFMQNFQERELKDARELKRQQENFMDMISHEMRNPMSAIVLTVESIAHELGSLTAQPVQADSVSAISRMRESTEIIMNCVQHQKRIVDDVLTLSKFDSGLLDICPVPVHLTDLLRLTMKLFNAELKKHEIVMNIVLDDSAKEFDWLKIDPSRLQQVIINLVTNAIKFTAGQDNRTITIILSASEARPQSSLHGCLYVKDGEFHDTPQPDRVFLGVEVVDTGRGMTAEESAKLFHKFAQASPKTYAEYGGSGLGLFICKQLCKLQGGAIGVSSALGKGTTFAFYITASRCSPPGMERRPTLPALPILDKPGPHTSAAGENDRTTNGTRERRIRILLVEDNLINQRVLRTTLERAQYEVQVANHGLEALDHIAKSQYSKSDGAPLDVVLLDVEMPVCDGLECARRVREQQRLETMHGHVPIIGVTANARAEQQQLAIEAGMDAVVTKPFKLAQLVDKLVELGITPG